MSLGWSPARSRVFMHCMLTNRIVVVAFLFFHQCLKWRPPKISGPVPPNTLNTSKAGLLTIFCCCGTEKLKLVGKKRVRRSFEGRLDVNVQLRLSTCGRRRLQVSAGQPVVLLVRITNLDGSTANNEVAQLISAPTECESTSTPMILDDHLGRITPHDT